MKTLNVLLRNTLVGGDPIAPFIVVQAQPGDVEDGDVIEIFANVKLTNSDTDPATFVPAWQVTMPAFGEQGAPTVPNGSVEIEGYDGGDTGTYNSLLKFTLRRVGDDIYIAGVQDLSEELVDAVVQTLGASSRPINSQNEVPVDWTIENTFIIRLDASAQPNTITAECRSVKAIVL